MSGARARRRARWVARGSALLGASVVALADGTVDVIADCGNTSLGVISGAWQVQVTYAGATGGTPIFNPGRAAGSSQIDTMTFTSTCAAPGQCSLQITPNNGGFQFASASGFIGPDPSTPLTQSGSTYASTFPSSGVGGPNLPPCPPPRLDYTLRFTTLQAVPAGGVTGWSAAAIAGTEDIPGGWTCNGNTGVLNSIEHYTLLAAPVGTPLPTSATLACAQTPAPVAVAPVAPPAAVTPSAPASTASTVVPSTISATLATPRQAFGSLTNAAVDMVITVALMLFITFPAQLFNKTLEENYDDIRDIAVRRFHAIAEARRRIVRESSPGTRLLAFSAVVLIGGLLGSLNDPSFGFNRSSGITYLGVLVSALFGVLVSTSIARTYRHARKKDERGRLHALPAGLLVAAACVLVSRITQFRPGYLYGVIAGVAFTKKLTKDEEGQSIVAGTGVSFAMALVAWFAWVPVSGGADPSVGTVLLTDFLASLAVGGLVGCALGLMPIKFLPGGALMEWNRWIWGSAFGLALFTLVQALLHPDASPAQPGNAPIITAAVLLVVFGAGSVAFNRYFEERKKRRKEEEGAKAEHPVAGSPAEASVSAAVPVEGE